MDVFERDILFLSIKRPSWDLNKVVDYLAGWPEVEAASLKRLSFRLVVLLAFESG